MRASDSCEDGYTAVGMHQYTTLRLGFGVPGIVDGLEVALSVGGSESRLGVCSGFNSTEP